MGETVNVFSAEKMEDDLAALQAGLEAVEADVATALTTKADTEAVNAALAVKANTADVDVAIDGLEDDMLTKITQAQGDALYSPLRLTFNPQTGTSYTPVLSDEEKFVTLSNAGAITVTLPQDSDLGIPIGAKIHFSQIGAGQVTFVAGTGAAVNATPTAKARAQYSTVTAIKRAANTWLLVGDLAAS